MSMRNISSLGQARDYGDRLSKLLKKYRELANFRLTQRDLASHLGVSARSIRDWETGINLPTARNLKKIIEVYQNLGLFTSGKELEEAEELWILRQGKDLSNTFPLFDAAWLESVSSTTNNPKDKSDQQPSDQTSTTRPEENITSFPTRVMAGNLPQQLTSFIGREKELVEIEQLLSHSRLLTITGTGGAGKTRLSQEIANRLQETAQANYSDGLWWIELTPLTDPQQVVEAIISALMPERRQEGDPYEMLKKYLQSKRLLLVLDNCEHLVEAVADLVRKLLRDCASLQILATSRESLNVAGEKVWPLEGLSLSQTQQRQQPDTLPAVRLFVERARDAQPLFELNSDNTAAVLNICCQLEGLPLAIELAAARVRGLGVEQISRRLQQNFKLLSGNRQTNIPHHQTIQGMIDWSYNLLPANEQLLLQRMAVFRGDFSLEAAEAVLGGDAGPGSESLDPDNVLILMLQLVNKSLVVAVASATHTEARYRLLEMVRQYSQEKLEESLESDYLSYKHCVYYTGLVEKGHPNYFSDQSARWADRLEQEVSNLRSALTWALASNHSQNQDHSDLSKVPVSPGELALRLSTWIGRFWQLKNYNNEGQRWVESSLALEELTGRKDLKAVRATAYFYLALFSINQTDQRIYYFDLSATLFEELGDKFMLVAALANLGEVQTYKGNYPEAKTAFLRSLALMPEVEDQYYLGYILLFLGWIALVQGNSDETLAFLQKSEAIHREQNDPYGLAYDLRIQSAVSRIKQDLLQALSKIGESLQIVREMDIKEEIAFALNELSIIQRKLLNHEEARKAVEESVAICEEMGYSYTLSYAYNHLAVIYIEEGEVPEARRLSKLSLAIRQRGGYKLGIIESLQTFALLAAASSNWNEYAWLYVAADTLRQQLGIAQDYMSEQTELERLNEQVCQHLDRPTLDQLRVKSQTDSLDEIIKQVLAS